MSPLVCVRPPIPQLWKATRNLLLCGVPSCHLLCVDVRFDAGVLDFSCRRLVRKSCVIDASPGAVASGFMASSAAACLGSMNPTHWSIASERLVGGGYHCWCRWEGWCESHVLYHGDCDFFAEGNQRDSNTSRDSGIGVNHYVTFGGCNGPSRCVEGD